MCKDVVRLRAGIGGDWVVTFGLPTRCHFLSQPLLLFKIFLCLHQSARTYLRHRRAREIVASWLEATIVELEVDEATIRERLLKRENGVGENHYYIPLERQRHIRTQKKETNTKTNTNTNTKTNTKTTREMLVKRELLAWHTSTKDICQQSVELGDQLIFIGFIASLLASCLKLCKFICCVASSTSPLLLSEHTEGGVHVDLQRWVWESWRIRKGEDKILINLKFFALGDQTQCYIKY